MDYRWGGRAERTRVGDGDCACRLSVHGDMTSRTRPTSRPGDVSATSGVEQRGKRRGERCGRPCRLPQHTGKGGTGGSGPGCVNEQEWFKQFRLLRIYGGEGWARWKYTNNLPFFTTCWKQNRGRVEAAGERTVAGGRAKRYLNSENEQIPVSFCIKC